MDSPVRKMLKRNDYNRHKLLRKIKRKREAEKELLAHVAEKELKRRLRKPKYDGGKDTGVIYELDNPDQARLNPETGGWLVVDENGKPIVNEGGYMLPEVKVRAYSKDSQFDPYKSRLFKEYTKGTGDAAKALAAVSFPFASAEALPVFAQVGKAASPYINLFGKAFQPSTWLNPVTGKSLLGTTAGLYADAGLQTYFAADAAHRQFYTPEGWLKTDKARKEGRYGDAALSLTGDAFDALMLANPVYKSVRGTYDLTKQGWNWANNIYDNTLFKIHPDSWTRGIGMTDTGLKDLVYTGVVRGNPAGTETTAKIFGKLYRKNRDKFRSIMDDTGRDGIALRWFSRTLSEDDFNAIKESAKKFKSDSNFPTMDIDDHGTVRLLERDVDPLSLYSTYQDYTKAILAQIAETEKMPSRIASGEVTVNRDLRQPISGFDDDTSFLRGTPIEERFGPNSDYLADGQPLSYWYPDGRNAATRGHDYAGSKYFVRVNNASQHMPFMHDKHLHPSFLEAPKLSDPDVEVFKRGPFGLTFKIDKTKLANKYGYLLAIH